MSDLKQRQDSRIDAYSLAALRMWLVMEPGKRIYNWDKCMECVVGLYLHEACGVPESEANRAYNDFADKVGRAAVLEIGFGRDDNEDDWTMGKALKRLDAYVKKATAQ
jgi:hypothetical protein